MNKVLVRCWKIEDYYNNNNSGCELHITYPENDAGYELITCLECGELYAVSVAMEIYIGPPLKEKLASIKCCGCGKCLKENFAYYPETYICNGKIYHYKRSKNIPSDEASIVKEFKGIYDD